MNIVKQLSTVNLVDLMEGCECWHIQLNEHGICDLVDVSPRMVPAGQSAEYAIKRAARTSTQGVAIKSEVEDRTMLRYLMRHRHTSPLEFVTFTFHHVLPIFVARQLIRHRTASVNETSLRYSEARDRFWIPKPDELRKQGTANKQGGDEPLNLQDALVYIDNLEATRIDALEDYNNALKSGMSRELARVNMPVNLYTEWFWSIDLHNLLHFLGLRQDKHAQAEIRIYADAMYELIKPLVPTVIQAYDDYHPNRGGLLLSALDLLVLAEGKELADTFTNKRELQEFAEKMTRLGEPELRSRAEACLATMK